MGNKDDAARYAYLVNVSSAGNHNKFYEIIENKDGSIDVNYGRVDKTAMHHHYAYGEKNFLSLISTKEAGGYKDVTALHMEKTDTNSKIEEMSYKPVDDEVVQAALERMIESSRLFISRNYSVSAKEITPKMINEAQYDLSRLSSIAGSNSPAALYEFNKALEELFMDIPRAMTNVSDAMAKSSADFDRIIQREGAMLDNLKGAIQIAAPLPDKKKDQTVLEARGLTMKQVSYKDEDRIIDHLGKDYQGDVERRFVRAFAVENLKTRSNYEDYKKAHHIDSKKGVKLFYHGSKVENWYSIMSTGLSLNPDARTTGKMFGQGLYFAPECRKALNYMDVKGSRWNNGQEETGYTAIFSVALGKAYEPNRILGSYFTGKDLPQGCDSVFASKKNPNLGLMNDEYIVFNQDACTIKYLMEMSHHFVRDLDYSIDRKAVRNALIDNMSGLVKENDRDFKTQINFDTLSDKARNELLSHFRGEDLTELTVTVDLKNDRIKVFTVPLDDNTGTKDISPDFTNDDLKFLTREIKKNFAEGEYEWSCLKKLAAELERGEVIYPLNSKSDYGKPEKEKADDLHHGKEPEIA